MSMEMVIATFVKMPKTTNFTNVPEQPAKTPYLARPGTQAKSAQNHQHATRTGVATEDRWKLCTLQAETHRQDARRYREVRQANQHATPFQP